MVSDYPKVLLVGSSAFNPYTGGGVTLSNLFRNWPRDRIAVAHADFVCPESDICDRYFELSPAELGWTWPISTLAKWSGRQGSATVPAQAMSTNLNRPPAQVSHERARTLAELGIRLLAREGLKDRANVTESLAVWAQDFQPDLIYTFLGSLGFIRLVRDLARVTNASVAVHMMDDWPAVDYRKGFLAPLLRARMEKELALTISQAAVCMGICPAMCEAYGARYGRQFSSFSNALDVDEWSRRSLSVERRNTGPTRVAYVGSIVPRAQLTSLKEAALAVHSLNEGCVRFELEIFSHEFYRGRFAQHFDGLKGVKFREPLDDDTITGTMNGVDVLLLPVNFDRESAEYIRYSNPTKLPAYMASGTSIFVYGPEGVDQVDRARTDGWGYVTSQQGVEHVKAALVKLAENSQLRTELGQRAIKVARRDHEVSVVRQAFQNTLKRASIDRV